MNYILTLLIAFLLTGCGTITTLTNSDEEISHRLKKQKTYCESVSRVYAGVSYNLCKLHSNPNKTYIDWYLGFYIFDTAASVITDTVVIPYTIYQQIDKGSVNIDS